MDSSFLPFLFVALALALVLILILGFIAYRGMIHHRIRDEAYQRQAGLESGDFDASALDLDWIDEDILSPGGYTLRAHALKPEGDSRRLAVFHHGIGWGWLGMIRYMEIFRAAGWNVVAYDSRGHGRSGGGRPSYGYYEKEDLRSVVDWAAGRDIQHPGRFGCEEGLLVFGESMGAATVLQYSALDSRLSAVIADCPYSSAIDELHYRLRQIGVPPGFRSLVVLVTDALCRLFEGFSLRDADCLEAVAKTDVPILLVHGTADRYVPPSMSEKIWAARKLSKPHALTELYLAEGARHAQSIRVDKGKYVAVLAAFIERAFAAD